MNYQTTATPITTEAEYNAARSAGARIEFTATGWDPSSSPEKQYRMPSHDRARSGGWISLGPAEPWAPLESWHLLRAFYPVDSNEEPEA